MFQWSGGSFSGVNNPTDRRTNVFGSNLQVELEGLYHSFENRAIINHAVLENHGTFFLGQTYSSGIMIEGRDSGLLVNRGSIVVDVSSTSPLDVTVLNLGTIGTEPLGPPAWYGVELANYSTFTNAGTLSSADEDARLTLSGDCVFLNGSTIEGNVHFGSGTLSGPGPTTINGTFVLQGGKVQGPTTWEGTGIFEWSGGSFSGVGNPQDIRTNILGTNLSIRIWDLHYSPENRTVTNHSVLENQGTITLKPNFYAAIHVEGRDSGLFVNHGAILIDSPIPAVVDVAVLNRGLILAVSQPAGLSSRYAFTNAAKICAPVGDQLRLTGNYVLVNGSTIQGEVIFDWGTISGSGPTTINGSFVMLDGIVHGPTTWNGPGRFHWAGGSFSGVGNPVDLRTNIFGTDLQIQVGDYFGSHGAKAVTNHSVLESHGKMLFGPASNPPKIIGNAQGMLVNFGIMAIDRAEFAVGIHNVGIITNAQATSHLTASYSFTNAGMFSVPFGKTVNLSGNFVFANGSIFSGSGTVVSTASIQGPGPTIIEGDFIMSSGVIQGPSTWVGHGVFHWNGGSFSGVGNPNDIRTNILSTNLNFQTGTGPSRRSITNHSVLENRGMFTLRTNSHFPVVEGRNSGVLVNRGIISAQTDQSSLIDVPVVNLGKIRTFINPAVLSFGYGFTNAGVLLEPFPDQLLTLGGDVVFLDGTFISSSAVVRIGGRMIPGSGWDADGGITHLQSGTVNGTGKLVNFGTLALGTNQTVSVDCSLENFGVIQSSGHLSLNGPSTLSPSGICYFPLLGASPQNGFGQINLGTNSNIGGTLRVTLDNGFVPQRHNSFALVKYPVQNGNFATQQFPSQPADTWTAIYSTNQMTVYVDTGTVITNQPASQIVDLGDSVPFSVSATRLSPEPLTYQWRKTTTNGVEPLVNGDYVSGVTSATLTLRDVTANDEANYDVLVDTNSISDKASLAVRPPVFGNAILAANQVELPFNFRFDSFNSLDSNLSFDGIWSGTNYSNGQYDVAKARDRGNIACAGAAGISIPHNSKVKGSLATFVTTPTVATSATVGSTNWVEDDNPGLQPGRIWYGFSASLPDVASPSGFVQSPARNLTVEGVLYDYVFHSGNYSCAVIDGKILVLGQAQIYVTNDISLTGTEQIVIQTNASMTLYCGGTNVLFSGQGIANNTRDARRFLCYGLAANTNLTFSSLSTLQGVIYASQAKVSFSAAAGDFHFSGAVACKAFAASGSVAFHYDEAIRGGSYQHPSIIFQPQNRIAVAGASTNFTISASGAHPQIPLSYRWQKNGTNLVNGGNISGATNATLAISGISQGDVANYRVVVSDRYGSITSSTAGLSLHLPPVITAQPAHRTNIAGTSATFNLSADSALPVTYNWRKNGLSLTNAGLISGATTQTLTIASVTQTDAATYSVVVSNAAGITPSSSAILTVIDPPTISTHPSTQTIGAGSNATFTVSAAGTAPLAYQWKKGSTNVSGATSTSLTLLGVSQADAGSYSVIVTNLAASATSSTVVLTVIDPPSITGAPSSLTVGAGSNATLTVTAIGTAPLSYQWQKNGSDLSGKTTATLALNAVSQTDAGNYRVVVTNAAGSRVSSVATLTVIDPPVIVTQPIGQSVGAGSNATFSVSVTGTGPLTYQWKKGSTNVPGATATSLTLNGISPPTGGSFSVVITNLAGSVTSSTAILTVIDPPLITVGPSSLTVGAGSNATFTITATGTAPLSYQWQKNGSNLAGKTTATLTLNAVSQSDAANYRAVVTNAAGISQSTIATLTVVDPPVILTHPINKSIGAGSNVTFTVSATGTAPSYQWRKGSTNVPGATSSSFTLTGLAQANSGSYFVVVTNVAGSATSSSAILTVIDPPVIIVQPTPTNLTVGARTNVTFTVTASGTAPLSYQWQRDGSDLPGQSTDTLSFAAVFSGSYRVIITNLANAITSSVATLTVIDPPYITSQPSNQKTGTNGTATFSVTAFGTLPLSYQWQKNSTNLSGRTASTLVLTNLSSTDAGSYRVVVTNLAKAVTSAVATLTIIAPPLITTQPLNQTANQWANVTFSVTATGEGPFTYQWRRFGTPIAGATASVLAVANIGLTNAGLYSVMVSSPYGFTLSGNAMLNMLPDETKPTLTITSPKTGFTTNIGNFLFTGTAKDKARFGTVLIQLNEGEWKPALSTGSATNVAWSTNISFRAGTNTILVKATDAAGNESAVLKRVIFYSVLRPLTVAITGDGTTIPTTNLFGIPTNGAWLEVGRAFRIKAQPNTNDVFTNWTGSISSPSNVLNFLMESNMALTANFIPNPFIPAAGLYHGLFHEETGIEHHSAGFLQLRVNKNFSYSGKVYLDGKDISISGRFTLPGTMTRTISRAKLGKKDLQLSLALDFANGTDEMTGFLQCSNDWTASVKADHAIFDKTPATEFATNYTVLIPGFDDPNDGPTGYSYGSAVVSTNGKIIFLGRLADYTYASQTVPISKNGDWPFYIRAYPQKENLTNTLNGRVTTNALIYKGEMLGWLNISPEAPWAEKAPTGPVHWIKTTLYPTNFYYPNGFTNETTVLGAFYHPPTPKTLERVLDWTSGSISFAEGNLDIPFANSLTLGTNHLFKITAPNVNSMTLKVNAKLGTFSGTFRHPNNLNKVTSFGGAIQQDLGFGAGVFLGTNESGSVQLGEE